MISQAIAQARLAKLRGILTKGGYDAAAIVPGANLMYLTGAPYEIASRPLVLFVLPEGDPALVIPVLETPRIEGRSPIPVQMFAYTDAEGFEAGFERACSALGLAGKRIAVEGLKMRVLEGQTIQKFAPGASVESGDEYLIWLRMHKDAEELAAMKRAIAISEKALEATLRQIEAGISEREATQILLREMEAHGGEGLAFEPIVLSGPNSGQPHGNVGERKVQQGEILLFDFGARKDNYPADITRTFVIGQPNSEVRRIYETVLAANQAAIRTAGPGVTGHEVDQAARRVITEAGYGQYFIHRTGHGLGLDIHEAPYMRENNMMKLEPGMVFTIEPGIYIPGLGGVRIEDNIVITETGAEVMTSFPKTLRSIG